MKKILLTVTMVVIATVTMVGQRKTSNYTALLIESKKEAAAEMKNSPLTKTIKTVNGKEYVDCYVHFAGTIDESVLEEYGAKIHCRYDFMNVATASVPLEAIEALSEDARIKKVEAGTPIRVEMDRARHASHFAENYAVVPPLTQSYLGRGIVVGVVDGDMQLTHPAFWNSSHTRYRIKRVWNQGSTSGITPSGFSYGSEYTDSASILRLKYDTKQMSSGHATHVAGIAVGADHSLNYYGIAQESDIVFVSENGSMSSTAIADGIKYCFDYAKSVGKPCVVNVSMGSTIGPHDGNSTSSKIIDGLVGPGYIAVGSAGNSGDNEIHAGKVMNGTTDTTFTALISYLNSTKAQKKGYAYIDVYGDTNQIYSLQVVVFNKDSKTNAYASAPVAVNQSRTKVVKLDTVIGTYGRTKFTVNLATEITDNNRGHVTVVFTSTDSVSKRHNVGLRVVTADSGMVNMWSYEEYSEFAALNQTGVENGNTDYTVDEPMGTTKGVITVGSYVSRPQSSSVKEGAISSFSSKGPTADHRVKPDVAAPGEYLMSAYPDINSISDGRAESTVVDGQTYYYGLMQGTSMSSPYCAGVVATWLEADPTLDPDGIRDVFAHSVLFDSFTGDASDKPNNTWGMGKLNNYYGLLYILGYTAKEQNVEETGVLVAYPNPTNDILNIGFPVSDENVSVSIYDLSGKCVYVEKRDATAAGEEMQISVGSLRNGAYIVKVAGRRMNDTFKLIKQ